MDYQLANPSLGISAEAFVETWNAEAECRAVATAQLADAESGNTSDPAALSVAVLSFVAGSAAMAQTL